jgi:hypothetical protein
MNVKNVFNGKKHMNNGMGMLIGGLSVAVAILVAGVLQYLVASQERADLARFQCAQISEQVDYKIDQFGSVTNESRYTLDNRYTKCLEEKGLN